MSQPPPIPLEYRSRGGPPSRDPDAPKWFAWGFMGGMAVSAAVYFAGWGWFPNQTFVVGMVIAAVKALAFLFMTARRGLGLGILASIPVGLMIFLGSCMVMKPKL